MGDPLLEVEDLTIQYRTKRGDLTAVSNASFTLEKGEYLGLVGESGCGKSTIASALIGLLDDNGQITSGTVQYKDMQLQDNKMKEWRKEIRWSEISLIPQGSMNSLDPLQRIADQAEEICQVHSDMAASDAKDRLRDLFEIVGLQKNRIDNYPHQLSGGMQQRAIIALSLLLEPTLIIADEPTTALDVIMQDQIFKHIDEIVEETETSILLITHDISVVFESCDKIAIMHAGQIAETGTIRELFYNPRHPYTILLQEAFPDVRYPNRNLEVIEGNPPQVFGDVDFCTFVDRCPWATDECRAEEPGLESTGVSDTQAEHAAACFRKDEVAELYKRESKGQRENPAGETR